MNIKQLIITLSTCLLSINAIASDSAHNKHVSAYDFNPTNTLDLLTKSNAPAVIIDLSGVDTTKALDRFNQYIADASRNSPVNKRKLVPIKD